MLFCHTIINSGLATKKPLTPKCIYRIMIYNKAGDSMKGWIKVLLVTVIFAIPAFLLGRIIWPASMDMPAPTPGQLPFFMIVSAIEAIAFGLGISFLIFGWKTVKKASGPGRNWVDASFISIIWFLVSWWPHDNLHISNGENMQRLLYIEWGFHVTLVIAATIVAYTFLKLLKKEIMIRGY